MTATTTDGVSMETNDKPKTLKGNRNDDDDDDDDEDEDEDYKPEDDVEAQDDDDDFEAVVDTNEANKNLSYHKRKAVDEAFQRLFGYEWGTEFEFDDSDGKDPAIRLLTSTFGPRKAAKLLGNPMQGKRRRIHPSIPAPLQSTKTATTSTHLLAATDVVLPKVESNPVMETKIFAGQAIQVQSQRESSSALPKKGVTSKLDTVLAQLAGPAKVTTVQKTSDDWEQFKQTDKQLQEELEKKAQGKEAFLVKQDFLNRVDHRRFELERDERDRERAKRGK